MIGFYRGILVAGSIAVVAGALPAQAQDNFDANKTPAQLYAADCAICHKTPQGLAKAGGVFGLEGFLREHYTASREAAAAIAAYVQAVDKGPPPAAKKPQSKRTAKGDEKGKPAEAKPSESKPEQIKSGEPKASAPKSGEGKSGDGKPGEAKSGDAKPGEAKAGDSKAVESKPLEPKTETPNPASKDEPEKKSD
jgi:uncharacterized low-complexity protein